MKFDVRDLVSTVHRKSMAAAAASNLTTHDSEDDHDAPVLSGRALEALREFISERQDKAEDVAERVGLVAEDWRLSQFWYEEETAETIAGEILRLCELKAKKNGENPSVACVACPTLYVYLKKMKPVARVQLLEYDRRFARYGGDFTFYDYNQPEELPPHLKHAFQVVVADPPYLSRECLEKVSYTITFLAGQQEPYLMLLTGDVQRDGAAELLNLQACGFRPKHSSKLGNDFRLFTNYDPEDRLGGREPHS